MNNYEIVNWGEVINIKNGRSQEKVVNKDGMYPIYGSGGIMGYADDYLCIENTVIIGRKGSINNPIYVTTKFWNVDTAFGLETDKEKLDSKYLFYFCQNYNFEKLNTTVTIPSLTKSNLLKIKMKLPPINRQREIVAYLDKASDLVKLNKRRLEELDNLINTIFYNMFGDPINNEKGWKKVKLEKIAQVGSSRRVFVEELVKDGIPFYRGTEIGALSLGEKIVPTLFISKEHYNSLKLSTGVPAIGDLLMPSICPDGRIWCVDTDKPFYFKDGRVLWIHLEKNNISSAYLRYMLRQKFSRDYKSIASGTTFAELKIFALKGIDILLPPIELQNQFVEKVSKIEEQKSLVKQVIGESENLFNSLMKQYFD